MVFYLNTGAAENESTATQNAFLFPSKDQIFDRRDSLVTERIGGEEGEGVSKL